MIEVYCEFKDNFKDCKKIDLTFLLVPITLMHTRTSYQKLLCIG